MIKLKKLLNEILNSKYTLDITNKFVIIGAENEVTSTEPLNDTLDSGISSIFDENNIKYELLWDIQSITPKKSYVSKHMKNMLQTYCPSCPRTEKDYTIPSHGKNKIRKNIFIFSNIKDAQKACDVLIKIWEEEYDDPTDNDISFTPARAEDFTKKNKRMYESLTHRIGSEKEKNKIKDATILVEFLKKLNL